MNQSLTEGALAAMCEHMNEDHADAVLSYALAYAKVRDARSATMTALDARGFDLLVETADGPRAARVDFDRTVVDAEDAKQTLIRLAVDLRMR
jgi:putative heme iron utilization protein